MIVVPEKRAVLVQPRDIDAIRRLCKIIPTARPVNYKDKPMAAVPLRLDEMRVLNNLGLRAPSPILHTYKWPRSRRIEKPFDAQLKTAAFLTLNNRAFVLNEMGTGKSLAALWAYDYLRSIGQAGKLLVICPLSTMERTWSDEVFFNLPHLYTSVLYGTRKRRLKMLDQRSDVYILNHHGAKILTSELIEREDITHVVIDEISQAARNKRTDMWDALNAIVNIKGRPRTAWGMTATPTPNEPTDAWAQVRLLNPHKVPPYFKRFRDKVMDQKGPYKWVPKKTATDTVDEAMQPAIRFRLDQCQDIPATIYITREAELSPQQRKAYDEMHRTLRTQARNGEVLAVNEAVKLGKLVQIACGVAYDTQGREAVYGAANRIRTVLEAIEESHSKTIVFAPFRAVVEHLTKSVRKAGYSAEMIHGGVKKSERDTIFRRFQQDDTPQVIVAQPAAMSHGLTLVASSTIVWYAPITSADIYEQANGRIVRPGQKHVTRIVNIEGTPIERAMYARLKTKQDMQGLLLTRKDYREED